jgi:HEAT repeat protein
MAIKVKCPTCEHSYSLPESQEGKRVKCKNCADQFVVRDRDDDDDRDSRSGRDRSRDRDRDDDDRPRRRPSREGDGSSSVLMWSLIGGGIFLFLIIGIGVTVWYTMHKANQDTAEALDNAFGNFPNNGLNVNFPNGGNVNFPNINNAGNVNFPNINNVGGGPDLNDVFAQPKNLDDALRLVKKNDVFASGTGIDWIARAPVDQARRNEVLDALKAVENNAAFQGSARNAWLAWAGPDQVPELLNRMNAPGQDPSPIIDALGRIKDARGAAAVAKFLPDFFKHGQAAKALEAMGKAAESEVVKYLNHREGWAREETAKLVKAYGTAAGVLIDQSTLDLASTDGETKKQALESLTKTPVDAAKQTKVAQAIIPLLTGNDPWVRDPAVRALEIWATKDVMADLIRMVENPPQGMRLDSILNILAKFKDQQAAAAVAKQLTNFFNRDAAAKALIKMGPVGGQAALAYVNNPDNGVKTTAQRVVQQAGAGGGNDPNMGGNPNPNTGNPLLDQALKDLQSQDMGTRKSALDNIAKMQFDAAKQQTVSQALNPLLTDQQLRNDAINALVVWASAANIQALSQIVGQPGVPTDKIFDIFVKLKDNNGIAAIVGQLANPAVRGHARQALEKLGSAAENLVVQFLSSTKDRGSIFEAITVLGKIGTKNSLQILNAAARDRDKGLANHAQQAIAQINARGQ